MLSTTSWNLAAGVLSDSSIIASVTSYTNVGDEGNYKKEGWVITSLLHPLGDGGTISLVCCDLANLSYVSSIHFV